MTRCHTFGGVHNLQIKSTLHNFQSEIGSLPDWKLPLDWDRHSAELDERELVNQRRTGPVLIPFMVTAAI